MSWDAYVSDHLVGSGKLTEAAIIGLDGGVWATSPGLSIQPQEEQALINAFKSGPDQLQAHGIHIGGTKYMFLRPNGDSFYGKKGADGICVTKSGKAILIGEYKEGILPADANKVVEDMAAYLAFIHVWATASSPHCIIQQTKPGYLEEMGTTGDCALSPL